MQAYPIQDPQDRLKNTLFRITHTDMMDQVMSRNYLTLNKNPTENKYLAQLTNQLQQESQLWAFQKQNEDSEYFRIRNAQIDNQFKANLYLTLVKSVKKAQTEWLVELVPLQQGFQNQLWIFSLGQSKRFRISPKNDYQYFLQSQLDTYELQYKNTCSCKPKSQVKKWSQFWKISPVKEIGGKTNAQLAKFYAHKNISTKPITLIHFKGKFYKPDGPNPQQYFEKIQQYATSSYPSSDRMYPSLVVQPTDEDDIRIILDYAISQNNKVVARSGGHQYCGLSSGNQDTILVSMNRFRNVKMNLQTKLLEVQPCVELVELSRKLVQYHISIPHGQCFKVNIGGHAQTGGWGNLLRGFGLCTDYVQAFDIFLVNQKATLRVTRPKKDVPIISKEDIRNQQIFRGVLSGNAGSFGIITKYYFTYINDKEHPQSRGFNKTKIFSKQLFEALLYKYQQWSKLVANKNDKDLEGIDLIVSLSKFSVDLIPKLLKHEFKIISIFGYYEDPQGKKPMNKQLNKLQNLIESYGHWDDKILQRFINKNSMTLKEKTSLSKLANNSIFRPPSMTKSGRQFDLPYKKRCNVTMSALTDKFIKRLVELVVRIVYQHPQLSFVSQMELGGGACTAKGKQQINGLTITSIPLRDFVFCFTFDLFYKDEKGLTNAKAIQEQMKQIVHDCYNTNPDIQKRFFWATFGLDSELDMTRKQTIQMYYDQQDDYKQYRLLQKLKDTIDPNDVFHTQMTVKPSLTK